MMCDNSILKELVYDRSSGALTYKGVRYLLIRPETITGFQKAFRSEPGNETEDKLYRGGYTGGSLSAQKYKEIHGFSDREVLAFMMNMGAEIGWGHFTLDRYDAEEKALRVTVRNSPFAESYGASPDGVCHLIRGVLGGTASVLFGRDCRASETRCLARGDEHCVFEVEAK